MKKTTMPDWCVAVKKAMIDHDDMTVTELAKETGFSRSHISQVVNGVLVADGSSAVRYPYRSGSHGLPAFGRSSTQKEDTLYRTY